MVILNQQEKINAEFSGRFKQTIFKIGRDHLNFWKKYKILSNQNIMRMKDAELCSELIIAMIDGIQDKIKIKKYYKKYDDNFPRESEIEKKFKQCIDKIAEIYGDNTKKSSFKNSTLFYSLFCAIYDIMYGFPKSETIKKSTLIKPEQYEMVRRALRKLEEELIAEEPSKSYVSFKNASTHHTTDLRNRKTRHKFIVREILKNIQSK